MTSEALRTSVAWPIGTEELTSLSIHFGTNPSGHTFGQVTPDFKEKYMRPLVFFAKGVHCEAQLLA